MKINDYLRMQFELIDADDRPISDEEQEMLAIVAEAAYDGKDIATTFPQFWRALRENRRLQKELLDFIEALTLQKEKADRGISQTDLSFLNKFPPQPHKQQWSAARWRVKWHQTVGQLLTLINKPVSTQRRVRSWSRDIQLFEDHLSLEAGNLDVRLKLSYTKGSTRLTPKLIATHPAKNQVVAQLHWGSYSETIALTQIESEFPPVWLNQIGDGTLTGISETVELTLETPPDDRA